MRFPVRKAYFLCTENVHFFKKIKNMPVFVGHLLDIPFYYSIEILFICFYYSLEV